jgi:hypothetical protein
MKFIYLASVCLALAGCVEGSATNYTADGQYPATSPKSIQVVVASAAPRKYVVLGVLSENPWADAQASLSDAKARAAKMGADAITVPTLTKSGYWTQCLAIKYTD